MNSADNKKQVFEVGDLVIFSGVVQHSIKNKIGIIIGHSINAKDDVFLDQDWYVVQFGPMKLIVNDTMIEKIEKNEI